MSAKCRRWSGKWTIFDPLTFEVEQTHKVTSPSRILKSFHASIYGHVSFHIEYEQNPATFVV